MANSISRMSGTGAGAANITSRPGNPALRAALKVPAITIFFWIVKILTTAMGESTSDYLVYNIDKYLAVILGFVGLVVALTLQFLVRRYIPAVYWFAVVMVAIFGTMAADVMHIVLGVPYQYSAAFFLVTLAIIFTLWYATEKTLSIHSIYTVRREIFYWAAILATFALGTAAGDMTADTLSLGYLASGVLFAVLFLIPGVLFKLGWLNGIAAFWISYILTRPLGASFADYFGKPIFGGLGLGDAWVSLVLTVLIVALVGYLSISGKDTPRDDTSRSV